MKENYVSHNWTSGGENSSSEMIKRMDRNKVLAEENIIELEYIPVIHLFITVIKLPNKNNLKEKKFVFFFWSHDFRDLSRWVAGSIALGLR